MPDEMKQEYGPGKPGYQPAPSDEGHGDITSIALHRGACFGTCPVYDVTLNSDGTATYTGGPFAPRQGLHRRGHVITVTKGGVGKSVLQYGINEPPDFWVIAEVIDGLSGDISWAATV